MRIPAIWVSSGSGVKRGKFMELYKQQTREKILTASYKRSTTSTESVFGVLCASEDVDMLHGGNILKEPKAEIRKDVSCR